MSVHSVWAVKHYYANPRNNRSVVCDTRNDAVIEMRRMATDAAADDDSPGVSMMYRNGNRVARRDWRSRRISWF